MTRRLGWGPEELPASVLSVPPSLHLRTAAPGALQSLLARSPPPVTRGISMEISPTIVCLWGNERPQTALLLGKRGKQAAREEAVLSSLYHGFDDHQGDHQ